MIEVDANSDCLVIRSSIVDCLDVLLEDGCNGGTQRADIVWWQTLVGCLLGKANVMSQVLPNLAVEGLLVVDDENRQSGCVIDTAREVGFESIRRAANVAEAYEAIDSERFLVAVVDIMLSDPPGKGEGLDVIKYIVEKQPGCRIIALTTKGGNEWGIEALRLGADDFVNGRLTFVNWKSVLQQRLSLWRAVPKVGGEAF